MAERNVSLLPDSAITNTNVAACLGQLDRYEEALNSARKAISIDPNYPNAYLVVGRALESLKDHEAALKEYQRVLDLKPESVETLAAALINIGDAYLELGRNEDAIAPLLRAIELKPECPEGYENLGIAHFRLGNREAAEHELQNIARLAPSFESELRKLLNIT